MAVSSIKVALVNSADGTTYAKISAGSPAKDLCIKSVPDIDLNDSPDQIEITTMCDEYHEYMDGLKNHIDGGLEFTANYDPDLFGELKTVAKYGKGGTNKYWGIYIGESGASGKFTFEGYAEVRLNGFGVGEITEMTVVIHPTTAISFTA